MTKNKGVALILSIIILTAVLAIALTTGKIFTDKIKMSRNSSDSMKAYYAAESGIEYALYQIKQSPSWTPTSNCAVETDWTEVDGAKYCLEKTGDSIKAIGKAGETRRGIEVEVAQAAGSITAIETVRVSREGTLQEICQRAGYIGPTGFWAASIGNLYLYASDGPDIIPAGTYQAQCYK